MQHSRLATFAISVIDFARFAQTIRTINALNVRKAIINGFKVEIFAIITATRVTIIPLQDTYMLDNLCLQASSSAKRVLLGANYAKQLPTLAIDARIPIILLMTKSSARLGSKITLPAHSVCSLAAAKDAG